MGTGSSGKSSYSYYGSGKCYEIWTRVAKVFAYVLFSALVLGGAVLSKGATLLMTSAISDNSRKKTERDRWTLLLLVSICFPYLYTFLECLVKCCMGKRPWPSLCQMIGIMLVESAQTVGVSLFVFRVLPSCDAIRAVLLMNAVCIVPGIFKVFFARSKASGCLRLFVFLVDIVAVVFQVTVFFIILGTHYVSNESADGNLVDSMKNFISNLGEGNLVSYRLPWEAVTAVLLISVPWWENFMDANCNRLHQFAENMKRVRVKAYIFVSLWKIGLTLACSFLFLNGGGDSKFHNIFLHNPIVPATVEDDVTTVAPSRNGRSLLQAPQGGGFGVDDYAYEVDYEPDYDDTVSAAPAVDLWRTLSTYLPVFVQVVGSLLCYYFGKLACKVCMQRIGFALPLSLATPITIGIFIGICGSDPVHKLLDGNFQWTCHGKLDQGMFMWHLGIGLALWWLSQLWIAGHIWIAKNERLASTESLFVLPRYESAVIEQSMMLNRRRTDYFDRKMLRHPDEEDPDVTQSGACCCGGPRTTVKDGEEVRQEIMAPKILLCATMWHENEKEMLALLKSIFNMDADQSARRLAQEYFAIRDPDYYEFEAHIFFDDAMEDSNEGERTFNKYVSTLVETVDRAASAVHQTVIEIAPPIKTPTPYGGRLTWFMPGGNTLVVHMKDRKKSRIKKRWSQVMYMYFLLGFRLMGRFQSKLLENITQDKRGRTKKAISREDGMFFKDLLGPQNVLQAENTFILAVDGDVTFKPDAVRLLVDRMRKNKNVGAASGRIHPIGSGPVIWYQKFEYATAYWLQKATEHMLGCVLCAPGCFSLYRASSLLDDNVMRKFTSVGDEANQILQWDLGEDRWLCTLLLERGYRVEYCAAADCLTHAPKSFTEFFKQRRRWIPSTLANIVEIVINYKFLIKINPSISIWYILYQIFYVMSTILGPATIIIAIADALNAVTDNSLWSCFAQAALPAIIFVGICYLPIKQETQIFAAGVMGTYYAIQMMVVIVGTLVRVVDGSWRTTGVMFVVVLVVIFIVTALLHPMEISCIYPLMVYFLCIPIGYILIVIYSLCNLHVGEWGTREDIAKKQEEEDYQQIKKAKAIVDMIDDGRSQTVSDALLRQVLIILERIEKQEMLARLGLSDDDDPLSRQAKELSAMGEISLTAQEMIYNHARPANKVKRDDLRNPYWINEKVLRDGKIRFLDEKELQFWTKMIAKYLRPFPTDRRQDKKLKVEFKVLRDRLSFAFLMFNALWMALVFPLMLVHERLADSLFITFQIWVYDQQIKLEPLGLVHLLFFASILGIQFVSMLWHRWGTFLHILAFTEFKKKQEKFAVEQVVDAVKELQQIKGLEEDDEFPLPDYSDSDDNDTSFPEDSNVDYESDARGGNIPSDEHHYASIDAQIIPDGKKGMVQPSGKMNMDDPSTGKPHRRHRKGKDKRSYSKSFTKNSLDLAFKRRWYAYTQRSFREEAHGRRSIEDVFADQQQLPPGITVLQELKSKMKSDGTPQTPLPVRGNENHSQNNGHSRNDLNDLHHS